MRIRRIDLRAALVVTLFACGDSAVSIPIQPHPIVFVDTDFADNPDEWAGVQAALSAWEDVSVGIQYTRRTISHDDAGHLTNGLGQNTIVIVRNVGSHDPACPWSYDGQRGLPDDLVAVTWRGTGADWVGICLDAAYALESPYCSSDGTPTLQTVATHELGHALGLGHELDDVPAVMHPVCSDDFGTPTCADLRKLSDVWGTDLPIACLTPDD